MDFFGLIDAIRDYCSENNIHFLYGNDAYVNAISEYENGIDPFQTNDLILIADFTCIPSMSGGRVVNIKYSGIISLGRKSETDTESSLDETPEQKYDRRLKYLSTELASIIGELSCDNELDVSSLNFKFDLNKFDLNADFVAATITFDQ